MAITNVLECIYSMGNAGLNVVGEDLGYSWNLVCDEISTESFYAEDGDGAFTVRYQEDGQYTKSEILNEIVQAIFKHYPHVKSFQLVN